MKYNYFNTLNSALESEGLLATWQIHFEPIGYGQTFGYTVEDGTRFGHYVSIYRDDAGRYERPIHYKRG
jgi:hypothetical protein